MIGSNTIPAGISIIGNSSDVDHNLLSVDANILSFKTLVDGIWKSWSKNTPSEFQGFSTLNKGIGYIVNSQNACDITFSSTPLDINTVNYNVGRSVICLPKSISRISDKGLISKLEVEYIKSFDKNNWRSWTKGAEYNYQGVKSISDKNGYVVNITKVYTNILNTTTNNVLGVKLTSLIKDEFSINKDIISSINLDNNYYMVKAISEINSVVIDNSLSKVKVFINVDNEILEMMVPQELVNKRLIIGKLNSVIVDYGKLNNADGLQDIDLGTLGSSGVDENLGLIKDVQFSINKEYEYTPITNTTLQTAILPNKVVDNNIIDIVYDKLNFDTNLELKTMIVKFGTTGGKIEFAQEYLGKEFKLVSAEEVFNGTFTESLTPIVLS